MAGEITIVSSDDADGGLKVPSSPALGPREYWLGALASVGFWTRVVAASAAGSAVVSGILAAFPVMLWWRLPVSLPVSALVVALVGLRLSPAWGPVFAACLGLMSDAAGPGLPGTCAWSYLPVPIVVALLQRHLRRDHPLTLIVVTTAQAAVQTAGSGLGLRLAGWTAMPGHGILVVALVTSLLGMLLAGAAAVVIEAGRVLTARRGRRRSR